MPPRKPKTVRYPRNPDLDPQLVWKGKEAQDSVDLEVAAPPIYIQEKIHPQAIIEDIRAPVMSPQLDLFADFNDISFEQMIEFYQHDHHWSNRMILGDSLQVMASLAEKEGLKGQVQMIYIDPPYGIKFNSNWQVSTRKRDVKDGKIEDLTRQPEQIKAFRDTWELGIHSYLSYLRDRLMVARELLTESGSVFVQIGDENVHLVRCLLDEVFGGENFVSLITLKKMAGLASKFIKGACDYIVWYAKDSSQTKYRQLYYKKIIGIGHGSGARYDQILSPQGERQAIPKNETEIKKLQDAGWKVFQTSTLTTFGSGGSSYFPYSFQGNIFYPKTGKGWLTTHQGLDRLKFSERVAHTGKSIRYIRCIDDYPAYEINNVWTDVANTPDVVYVVQTNTKIIESCLLMTTDPGDLVLDPTCGSGTTAYVAEQWGRRWITCDTSRVALALARTRLMAARYPYYKLQDEQGNDVKKGFIYKTVPHITLKSIANNEEIDVIHERWQEKLEPLRAKINQAFKQNWEEWEIPREAPEQQALLDHWWQLRRERQAEIDASIARRADTETLYDQPEEDKKRVRVTGPFTVESLSPHRILPTDELPKSETEPRQLASFETMILDNLYKHGVQNTVKSERLYFERLEPYAGQWLQAEGEYQENDETKRVAVSIGPEHGTVSALQVKEAAKEAVQGLGFNLLLVCGFAFDPAVAEESKRYGKLTVLPVKMNPELSIIELKKNISGNLFMIFGEPDIQPLDPKTGTLKPNKAGKLQIELKGVDIYDPTTGQTRSHSTDDIACWFIDTNYNSESFFVRHTYFTGGHKPYEKLQKTLKADINEEAWSTLYSTKSREFGVPTTGRIAVKAINHYGDEMLKVFQVCTSTRLALSKLK